jgi:hypothetical protein
MANYTDRTIRANGQWVKITRDNKEKIYTFARGWEGEFKAHDCKTMPFKLLTNWVEATWFANLIINR